MRFILALSLFAFFTTTAVAQDEEVTKIGFANIEEVPVYPGCKGKEEKRKKCFSENISKFVNKNFDLEMISNIGLPEGTHRLAAQFFINTEGKVENIKVRGDYLEVNKELERVLSLIPTVEPGRQNGEAVTTIYSLPVIFAIAGKEDDKKKGKN